MSYDPSVPFEATVRWIKKETRDTATYALQINARDIAKGYAFRPGQFNMLGVPASGKLPFPSVPPLPTMKFSIPSG